MSVHSFRWGDESNCSVGSTNYGALGLLPAAQFTHAVCVIPAAYVPVAQEVQELEADIEYLPGEHERQNADAVAPVLER